MNKKLYVGNLPYTVSKHGLSGLTKTIAKEYAHLGITCNEICPGPIESEMMLRISQKEAEATNSSSEKYLDEVRQSIPQKRMAYPQAIYMCTVTGFDKKVKS